MIVYPIKEEDRIFICSDDGPKIMKSATGYEYAYNFAWYLKEMYNLNEGNKRILDVGMGNGNVLRSLKDIAESADVFGFDIEDYLLLRNYYEGRTFPNTDIRDIPENLLGTFDLAYQRFFSVPFKDTLDVLLTISKTLKPNGTYHVVLNDDFYNHEDSFIIKILDEIYNDLKIKKSGSFYVTCMASKPRVNPSVTPMENYYYRLTDEEYQEYEKAGLKGREKILSMSKKNN